MPTDKNGKPTNAVPKMQGFQPVTKGKDGITSPNIPQHINEKPPMGDENGPSMEELIARHAALDTGNKTGNRDKDISTYETGDVITYRAFGKVLRTVRVSTREPDVKNGRPGFDGQVIDGPERGTDVWGYDSQIEEVRQEPRDSAEYADEIRERAIERDTASTRIPENARPDLSDEQLTRQLRSARNYLYEATMSDYSWASISGAQTTYKALRAAAELRGLNVTD
jgi:hypothetical protein